MFQKISMNPIYRNSQNIVDQGDESDTLCGALTIFLVEYIPGGWNAFLSLLTGIGVKEVGKQHEAHRGRSGSTDFILFDQARQ